jgi:hypothetical protein
LYFSKSCLLSFSFLSVWPNSACHNFEWCKQYPVHVL